MRTSDPAQPLSAKYYSFVALTAFLFALGFSLLYVYWVPQLVESGVQAQLFYLLLLPWALSCAAFLFGVMKSYARFTHRSHNNLLELGGPVVLFCLVIVGGFKLVPPAPETFDLSVRAHSQDSPLITSGQITLDLPGLPHVSIGPDGEATFKGLPASARLRTIRMLPHVDGYAERWIVAQVQSGIADIQLDPLRLTLSGSLVPVPRDRSTIRIVVDGQGGEASPDALGRFSLEVRGKAGDRVRLRVYQHGDLAYDDYQVLPGPVTLSLP